MADRFVLTLINNRIVGRQDFDFLENGAVFLSDSGRRAVLKRWQERKKESLTHPYLQESSLGDWFPISRRCFWPAASAAIWTPIRPFCGSEAIMLVLITYDVNTADAAGRKRLRQIARQCVNYGQRFRTPSLSASWIRPSTSCFKPSCVRSWIPNGTASAFIPWEIAMSRRSSTLALSRPTFQTNL